MKPSFQLKRFIPLAVTALLLLSPIPYNHTNHATLDFIKENIYASEDGYIIQNPYPEGAKFNLNGDLIKLSNLELKNALSKQHQNLIQISHNASIAIAGLTQEEKKYEMHKQNIVRNHIFNIENKIQNMKKHFELFSHDDFINIQNDLHTARSNLEISKAQYENKLNQIKSQDIQALLYEIEINEKTFQKYKKQLDSMYVKAKHSGIIIDNPSENKPKNGVKKGELLLSVSNGSRVLTFKTTEKFVKFLKVNQKVNFVSSSGKKYKARIAKINQVVDRDLFEQSNQGFFRSLNIFPVSSTYEVVCSMSESNTLEYDQVPVEESGKVSIFLGFKPLAYIVTHSFVDNLRINYWSLFA